MRLHVLRIDRDRALELLDRIVALAALLVEQTEIVVNLGAGVVLLEQRAVVRQRVVEVADALVVQREAEVILGRSRRRRRRRRRRLRRGLPAAAAAVGAAAPPGAAAGRGGRGRARLTAVGAPDASTAPARDGRRRNRP